MRALGEIMRDRHEREKARVYYTEAETLFTALGDSVDLARVLNALGAISFDETDYLTAQEYHEQAHTLAHEQGAKQIVGRALRGLGDVARVLHNFKDAEHHYNTAFAIATELDTPAEQCAVLRRQGLLYYTQERFYDALGTWVHALALDVRLGHATRIDLQTHVANMVNEHHLEEAYTAFCKQFGMGSEK